MFVTSIWSRAGILILIVALFQGCTTDNSRANPVVVPATNTASAAPVSSLTEEQRTSAAAAFELGLRYFNGTGVQQDDALAVQWYKRAADAGMTKAQAALAYCYILGRGVPKNYVTAVGLLEKASAQGDAAAQTMLAALYLDGTGGVPRDDQRAIVFLQQAAAQGYLSAKVDLSELYAEGRGFNVDIPKALRLLTEAANGGLARAQVRLGVTYYNGGRQIPKDYVQAMYWFRKAADQNNLEGQTLMAIACLEGKAQPKDEKSAFIWMQKAAAHGGAKELYYLSNYYHEGIGTNKDPVEALRLMQKSADLGFSKAQYAMGVFYAKGDGIPQDQIKASSWFAKAAAGTVDKDSSKATLGGHP